MEASNDVRVLKSGTCPSLSGKSKLGYEVGCGLTSDLYVRVCKNSGTGFFSKDWVAWMTWDPFSAKATGSRSRRTVWHRCSRGARSTPPGSFWPS